MYDVRMDCIHRVESSYKKSAIKRGILEPILCNLSYKKNDNYVKIYNEFTGANTDDERRECIKKYLLDHNGKYTQILKSLKCVTDFIHKWLQKHELPQFELFLQSCYHVIFNITDQKTCEYCNREYTKFNKFLMSYYKTCSHDCNNKLRDNIEKRLVNNGMGAFKTNVGKNKEYICNACSRIFKLKFIGSQHIKSYVVDGVDYDHKVILEVNEGYHLRNKQYNKDVIKYKHLKKFGYKIIVAFDMSSCKYGDLYDRYINFLRKNAIDYIEITPSKFSVLTSSGWSKFCGVKQVGMDRVLHIETQGGISLKCTEDHKVFTSLLKCKRAG